MSVLAVKNLSFGQWFRIVRSEVDLPQARISKALGVTVQTVSNWENDKSVPNLTPEQTRILCDLLDVDLDTLARAFRGDIEIG